jgi:hypothetical protein
VSTRAARPSRLPLAYHQFVVAGGRIVLAGKHQPVVGGEDDLGGEVYGADSCTAGR